MSPLDKSKWMLLLFSVWGMVSCQLLDILPQKNRLYHVIAPDLPPNIQLETLHWQGWRVQIVQIKSSRYKNKYTISHLEYEQEKAQTLVELILAKQESALIFFYPKFRETSASQMVKWKPAAASLLWQERSLDFARTATIKASWIEGYRCSILAKLVAANFDIRTINSRKLRYYIKKKISQYNPIANPWLIDSQHLVTKTRNYQLKWTDIHFRKTLRSFRFPKGLWQPLNMLDTAINCQTNCTPELSLDGQQYFLNLADKKLWHISVVSSGEVLALPINPL